MENKELLAGKYLTLKLKGEFYGINVDDILQIIALPPITPVPNTPRFMKGVINLRGQIIPVIDLRCYFDIGEIEYNERTSIVIIKEEVDEKRLFMGVIVDLVSEVLDVKEDQIEESPDFGIKIKTDNILAMAKIKDRVVTLLNIERILKEEELVVIKGE